MQLNLAFLDPPDSPLELPTSRLAPIPWDRLDAAAREAALQILARLIADMLAAAADEASHE